MTGANRRDGPKPTRKRPHRLRDVVASARNHSDGPCARLAKLRAPMVQQPATIVPQDPLRPAAPTTSWELELERTRHRYDRIAPIYDLFSVISELRLSRWRRRLWELVTEGPVLELGVGTGKSLRLYPPGLDVVGIDISQRMLARARRRARRSGPSVRLELADAQDLPYDDGSFATVVTTCVFCSIPEPARALAEARRVLQPGGRLLMLEHVLSHRPRLRRWMQWLDPISAALWGAHIDRDTVDAVGRAGFADIEATPLWLDVVQLVCARNPQLADTGSHR